MYLATTMTPIIVYTDHNPLVFLKKMKNKNQRLIRWSLYLETFDLDIRHIKGKDNVMADALSRVWDAAESDFVYTMNVHADSLQKLIWLFILIFYQYSCFILLIVQLSIISRKFWDHNFLSLRGGVLREYICLIYHIFYIHFNHKTVNKQKHFKVSYYAYVVIACTLTSLLLIL